MCPSLIQIGSKTAEKNSAQTNRQTDRHYENNGHLAVNQYSCICNVLCHTTLKVCFAHSKFMSDHYLSMPHAFGHHTIIMLYIKFKPCKESYKEAKGVQRYHGVPRTAQLPSPAQRIGGALL